MCGSYPLKASIVCRSFVSAYCVQTLFSVSNTVQALFFVNTYCVQALSFVSNYCVWPCEHLLYAGPGLSEHL